MTEKEQIKQDLLDILNKHQGGCLCGHREICENCDSYSNINRLKTDLWKYTEKL